MKHTREHPDVPDSTYDCQVIESRSLLTRLRDQIEKVPDPPTQESAEALHLLTSQLVQIAKHLQRLRLHSEEAQQLFTSWKESHTVQIQRNQKIADFIRRLDDLLSNHRIAIDDISTIISACTQYFDTTEKCHSLKEQLTSAINGGNAGLAESLLNKWKQSQFQVAEMHNALLQRLDEITTSNPSDGSSPSNRTKTKHEPAASTSPSIRSNDISTESKPEKADSPSATKPNDEGSVKSPMAEHPHQSLNPKPAENPAKKQKQASKSNSNPPSSPQRRLQIDQAIPAALERNWIAIAYYLAKSTPNSLPTVESIEFIAMNYATEGGSLIGADMHELAAQLHDITRNQLAQGELDSSNQSYLILITVAALRPALIVPGSSVAQLISLICSHINEVPALQQLAKIVADVSMKNVPMPLDLLSGRSSTEKWTTREKKLRSELRAWIDAEKESRLKYEAATRVWHYILSPQPPKRRSSIGNLFEHIASSTDSNTLDSISAMIEHWRQNANKEIDQIDRSIRPLSSTRRIDGPARIRLKKKIAEAVDLATRWHRVMTSKPQGTTSTQGRLVDRLRKSAQEYRDKVRSEIAQIGRPLGDYTFGLAEAYFDLFEPEKAKHAQPSMTLQALLHGDLYALPEVSFHDNGEPFEPPTRDRLIGIMEQNNLAFIESAVQRAERADFRSAEATLAHAEMRADADIDSLDDCRAIIASIREHIHERFAKDIKQTSSDLDATYALGALDMTVVDRLRSGILSSDTSHLAQIENFEGIKEELEKINREIKDARETITTMLKARLQNIPATESERKLIDAEIDKERYLIADEFIERLAEHKQLPVSAESQDTSFRSFFPSFVEKYSDYRREHRDALDLITQALEHQRTTGPFDISGLTQDSMARGISLLRSWTRVALDHQNTIQPVRELLHNLGFTIDQLRRTSGGTILNTSVIANREIIQLPDFGSRANGRYAVLVVRGRSSAEAITSEVGSWTGNSKPPMIVIFLNVLSREQRSILGSTFHSGEYTPTVVLDEALVVYLALNDQKSLQLFFKCATPFSFAQPFDPNTPQVPVEMFFGRKDERSQILSMGSFGHLVYGGRRLGKTALMYDIVREHRSSTDTLVIMIDLRGRAVGGGGPTRELWRLVAQELHRRDRDVVGGTAARYETIAKGVREWLEKSDDRRILLLIDEADAFLESDRRAEGTPYPVLAEMKRLMEATNRRFKVVFAGLHNVQRVAQDPNTPLAHFGEPVQIGPMLPTPDGGGREIESLIRIPLEALGYTFESPYSVVRIAAETNYYPALVQQFCMELLAELRRGIDSHQGGPPYLISPDSVDKVFNSRQTRDRIRNLFLWTIELDPRYEFLTYLIAFHSLDSADTDVQLRGVDIRDIRDSALQDLPQSFSSNSSYLTFEVLLEEMVGLGILREDSSNGGRTFAIRSRNLRRLLGQDEEILMRLQDAQLKDAPPAFDPAEYRVTLARAAVHADVIDPVDSLLGALSPFTSAQERILLSYTRSSVVVMFGTVMAGRDRSIIALSDMVRRVNEGSDAEGSNIYVQEWPELRDVDIRTLSSTLDEIKRRPLKASRVNLHVLVIDVQGNPSADLVKYAVDFVSDHQVANRVIRPVFVCDPAFAWRWVGTGQAPWRNHSHVSEVWLERCSRNFVRDWLQQRVDRSLTDLEDAKYSGDGLWPIVVETAASHEQFKTVSDAVRAVFQNDAVDVSEVVCEDDIRRVLECLVDFESEYVDLETLWSLLEAQWPGEVGQEDLVKILQWARSLGIVRRRGGGYRIDSSWSFGLQRVFAR